MIMTKVITISYDIDDFQKTYFVDSEDDKYYYFIDGWTGEKKRLHKEKNIIEGQLTNGTWERFADWKKYVDIIKIKQSQL
jgi:phenylalanine-4-hydroxylase